MSNFLLINEIKSLFIDVSEQIDDKNLRKFIFTTLKLKNITITKNDFVYINFISELKQYQILIFPNRYKNLIFLIFDQYYLNKKEQNNYDLYIMEDFFCLYKNGEFYYYQTLESEIFVDDLVEYINKNFSIKVENYKVIDKKDEEELKNNYLKKSLKNKFLNFNSKKDFSFMIYILYVFILSFSSIYIYINYQENDKNLNKIYCEKDFQELKKEYLFISFLSDFHNFLELSQKYDLTLKTFEYKENKIKVILSSASKTDIYSFFNDLKTKLVSQEINYFENEKIYESTIYVNFFK